LWALAWTGAIFVLQRIVGPVRGIYAALLGQQLDRHLEERVMRAVCAPPGIAHLDDPATLDGIARAQSARRRGRSSLSPAAPMYGWSSRSKRRPEISSTAA
jgi:hypothetical protein